MCRSRRFHELVAAVIHDAVVALGVGDDAGVLRGVEETLAVVLGVVEGVAHHVAQDAQDRALAKRVALGQ